MNPKNIKIWESNGGFGHGCAEKIAIEQAKDKALHQSMDTFVGLSIDQIIARDQEKEIPLKRGIFSEV